MTPPTQVAQRAVRFDRLLGLSPLFRPLPKRALRTGKLDVRYEPEGGTTTLHFRGPDPLGMPEQTMLLVLLEIAAERLALSDDCRLSEDAVGVGAQLWQALGVAGAALDQTVFFSTTWYELARRRGASPGGSVQRQSELQLKRLCETTVWERWRATDCEPGGEMQSRLISWLYGDDCRVHVALNVRLADALCGGTYSQVSLHERMLLTTDVARAVHAFLSVVIRHGHHLRVRPETLSARLWPGEGRQVPDDTRRRRIRDVCRALRCIGGNECWRVQETDGVYQVERLANAVARPSHAREKTGHEGGQHTSKRTRAHPEISSPGADFGRVDASGLFCTK